MILFSEEMSSADDDSSQDSKDARKGPKTAYDIQRSKLEKLMKNPEKPVNIPGPRKEKDPNKAPEFVYNVMGSSAGAGSGEFHVYRQIRRKEFLRTKVLDEQLSKDKLNDEYHAKLEENQKEADDRTAKKRAKRLKKKQKQKQLKKKKTGAGPQSEKKSESEESEESEEEKEEDNKEAS